MSSTPLMAEYPVEKKLELPQYAVDESTIELSVGQPATKQCFWSKMRCCKAANSEERPKKSLLRRVVRFFLLTGFLLFVISHIGARNSYLVHPHFPWPKPHPIICVPITETTTSLELPLANRFTKIGVHPSLGSKTTIVTHSDKVANGTVKVAFELPEDTELMSEDEEAKLFYCFIAGPKFVGVGIHAAHKKHEHKEGEMRKHHEKHGDKKFHHGHGPKAIKTEIILPASEEGHARGVSLHGPGPWWKHGKGKFGNFGRGCMKKRIRKAIAKAAAAARAEKWAKIEHADAE